MILGAFPVDTTFASVRGLWWGGPDDPQSGVIGALHRIMMALSVADVLNDDAQLEFEWTDRVDVITDDGRKAGDRADR